MGKSAIITFLSPRPREIQEDTYTSDKSQKTYLGTYTNDAPVRCLMDEAKADGTEVSKIVCIVSKQVYDNNSEESVYQIFKKMVKKECKNTYDNEVEIKKVLYDFVLQDGELEEINGQQNKALSIYQGILEELKDFDEVYIDYTGGMRDVSFLITVIIRYLEFINVKCRDIIYSNYGDKMLYSLAYLYEMFQLLNAVSQFVETGNANLLSYVYRLDGYPVTQKLVDCMNRFSQSIILCDLREMDIIIKDMTEQIKKMEQSSEPLNSIKINMFHTLVQVIKQKFYLKEGNAEFTYPKLIKWCLDNHLLQQALTLYVEKMPIVYYQNNLVKKLEVKDKKNKMQTEEVNNFFTLLFEDIFEVNDKVSLLNRSIERILKEYAGNEDLQKSIKQVMTECEDSQVKKAIKRILHDMMDHYTGLNYVKKKLNKWHLDSNLVIDAGNGEKFLNEIKASRKKGLVYVYENKKDREKYVYEYPVLKKLAVIEMVAKMEDVSQYTEVLSKEQLRDIMLYYLAIKNLRNRVNHASEEVEAREDEALAQGLKAYQIPMAINVDSITKLISDGLMLRNPELF